MTAEQTTSPAPAPQNPAETTLPDDGAPHLLADPAEGVAQLCAGLERVR